MLPLSKALLLQIVQLFIQQKAKMQAGNVINNFPVEVDSVNNEPLVVHVGGFLYISII